MSDTWEIFLDNLIISETEKQKARRDIYSKGIQIHILIKKMLLPYHSDGKIKYAEIASTYRYDKRIRNVLFKYISYLEEFYRGILLDEYYNKTDQEFWILDFKKLLEKYEFRIALEKLGFKELINQMTKLPKPLRQKSLFCNKNLESSLQINKKAIIDFRNIIMHNKFLLLYTNYLPCIINNIKKEKLEYNILNLVSFLPKEVGDSMVDELKNCSLNKNKSQDVKWKLPKHLILDFNVLNNMEIMNDK